MYTPVDSLVFFYLTTGGIMEKQANDNIMIEDLLGQVNNLKITNDILDKKLDKALQDRIVLRNENFKLKEQLKTQTRTQHTQTGEEECLACSA